MPAPDQIELAPRYPIVGRIWRNRRTRSSIGGCVENRLAMPPPRNGLTMYIDSVA